MLLAGCAGENVQDGPVTFNAACNCFEAVRDNPVLAEDTLLSAVPSAESGLRPDDQRWAFNAFDLTVSLDTFVGLRTFHEETSGQLLHFWPSLQGTWEAAASPTGLSQMPWQLHGARLGYNVTRVQARKILANSTQVLTSNSTRFRLSPSVELVPIQVIVVKPAYSAPNVSAVMEKYTSPIQDVLWDDRWRARRQRITHPGGLLASVQGQWELRTQRTRAAEPLQGPGELGYHKIAEFTRPDDLFARCGIQFRMVRYIEQLQDREHVELIRPDGQPICDLGLVASRYKAIISKAADEEGLRKDLPTVVFNYTVEPLACFSQAPRVDFACRPQDNCGLAGNTGYVGVGVLNVLNSGGNRDLVLGHEVGHVLGLNDLAPDPDGTRCDSISASSYHLMCGSTATLSTFVADDECTLAKSWAAAYRSRW